MTGRDATEHAAKRLATAQSQLGRELKQMAQATASGRLTITPEDGQALYRALLEQLDRVDSWIESAGGLSAPIPLGGQWVGTAMSAKFTGRADDSDTALLPALRSFRESLRQAAQAIASTLSDYVRTEEDNLAGLKASGTTKV